MKYPIARLTDGQLLQIFSEFGLENDSRVHSILVTGLGINTNLKVLEYNTDGFEKNEYHISAIEVRLDPRPEYQFFFKRAPNPLTPIIDEITIPEYRSATYSRNISSELYTALAKSLLSRFDLSFFKTSEELLTQTANNSLIGFHHAILERLEKTSLDLIEKHNASIAEFEKDYKKREKQLDTEIGKKRKELEEELKAVKQELKQEYEALKSQKEEEFRTRKDKLEANNLSQKEELESEYQSKNQELIARENAVEEKIREIDDRDNTTARRDIRKDIIEEIKQRTQSFSLTQDTNKRRVPIFVTFVIILVVLLVGVVITGFELFQILGSDQINTTLFIGALVRQVLFGAGFAGFAIFFIKWMNRWFEQHAQAEFRMRQFHLDIERASWVVETTFEWKDTQDQAIPEKLLDSLTANLFASGTDTTEKPAHPADQLTSSLLNSVARVKVKQGDTEVELDNQKKSK